MAQNDKPQTLATECCIMTNKQCDIILASWDN